MANEEKKTYLNSYGSATRTINRCQIYIDEIEQIESSFVRISCSEDEAKLLKAFKESIVDRMYEQKKVCHLVRQSINTIPEGQCRDVIQYRYIDGKTWEEIADKMMYSLQHIHKIHNKALEQLAGNESPQLHILK